MALDLLQCVNVPLTELDDKSLRVIKFFGIPKRWKIPDLNAFVVARHSWHNGIPWPCCPMQKENGCALCTRFFCKKTIILPEPQFS